MNVQKNLKTDLYNFSDKLFSRKKNAAGSEFIKILTGGSEYQPRLKATRQLIVIRSYFLVIR